MRMQRTFQTSAVARRRNSFAAASDLRAQVGRNTIDWQCAALVNREPADQVHDATHQVGAM